jgi:hypothetical protein
MTVSLSKNGTVAAARALGQLVHLAPGVVVRVTNVQPASTGNVTLSAETVNGALLVRTVRAGRGYPVAQSSV